MKRLALIVIIAVGIGIARLTLAHSDEKTPENGEHVKVLASYDVKEQLDGKDRLKMLEAPQRASLSTSVSVKSSEMLQAG